MSKLELPPVDLDTIKNQLGLKTTAGYDALRIALENVLLLDKKQQDYGPKNISGFGAFGVIVRMNDKFERLKTLHSKRRKRAVNESMHDTLRDISNYAIIALMLEKNLWPKE